MSFSHYVDIARDFLSANGSGGSNGTVLDPALAKRMGVRLNELTANPSEVDRFCLGVTFLSWPFLNADAGSNPMTAFLSVSAAKQLLVSVGECVTLRVTRTPKHAAIAASGGKAGKKKAQQHGGALELTLEHFHRAVDEECGNCCFLRCFDPAASAAIPANTRRIVNFCVGALLAVHCALAPDRGTFVPGSVPWPAFHQAFLPVLDAGAAGGGGGALAAAVAAWEFLDEFVASFQKNGVSFPNLVGYAAELIKYGLDRQRDGLIAPACGRFAHNLVAATSGGNTQQQQELECLKHVFQTVSVLCNMNSSTVAMTSNFDRGGGDRRSAQNALMVFVGACHAVTDAIAEPLAALLLPLPAAIMQLDQRGAVEDESAVPVECFELVNNAVECMRALIAGENGVTRQQTQSTFDRTTSLFLLVAALGRFAPACRDEVRACVCTTLTALTEMLDNAETKMFDAVLAQPLPPSIAAAVVGNNNTEQQEQQQPPRIGEWFLRRCVLDWMIIREQDASFNAADAFASVGLCRHDFAVEDSERDVLLKLRSRKEGRSGGGGGNDTNAPHGEEGQQNGGADDGDEDDEDAVMPGEEDEDMLLGALGEDGVAKSAVRQCVLDLFGALSTALPVSTAPVLFRVCSTLIEEAGPAVADNSGNKRRATEAAAVLEACFVSLSEIIDETFHVLRQTGDCMSVLIHNVFRAADTDAIANRPGVMAASLRLAGMVALACANAICSGEDDNDDDDGSEGGGSSQRVDTRMAPEQVRVVVSGAELMLRHLILRGVNSPFKRCNWAAMNQLAHYTRLLMSALHSFSGDDDDDEDDNNGNGDDEDDDEQVIRSRALIPKAQLRDSLFPPAAEEALFEILFAEDGANWASGAEAQQQSGARAPLSQRASQFLLGQQAAAGDNNNNNSNVPQVAPLPVLQLLSRSIARALLRFFVSLDVRTARFYADPKDRSARLVVPRYAQRIIRCVQRGWATRGPRSTLELNVYVEMLRHMAPVLAIPVFDGANFLAPLETVCADIRAACVAEMKTAVAASASGNTGGKGYQSAEWRDAIVAMMCDTLSDICDNLALAANRLVALQRLNFPVAFGVENPSGIVNPAAAQLVLTDEVMELASSLVRSDGGGGGASGKNKAPSSADLRRVAFALLADFAAAHQWWRSLTVVSAEATEAARLPLEDVQGGQLAERELPPPCVDAPTPAMQRLSGFVGTVVNACHTEIHRFLGYDADERRERGGSGDNDDDDDDDDDDESEFVIAVANALWCLSQWFGAAAGPPQHTAAVAQSWPTNPNTAFIARALPTRTPGEFLAVLTAVLVRSEGVSMLGTLRENCLGAALRLASLFPQGLGPLGQQAQQQHGRLSQAQMPGVHNVMAYLQRGLVAAALAPIAAGSVATLSNAAERQEALQRIGALATVQVPVDAAAPGGEVSNTFMFCALQQLPAPTIELAAAVERGDLQSTVAVWGQIIHFVAQSPDADVQALLKKKKAKLRAAFNLQL